jgi:uncharacterized protein (TIGR02996 family)
MDKLLAAAAGATSTDAIADLLCEAWRSKPSARLARIIEQLDACTTREAKLAGKTVPKREEGWCEAAAEADEIELVGLLRLPWPTRLVHVHERMDVLEDLEPSARISNALLALERRRQYYVTDFLGTMTLPRAGVELSRRIAALLARWRDPAVKPKLEPKFSPKARAILQRLESKARATVRDDESLLASVYDTPFDDGPRAVFGDHLQLAGSPRGEFIALQLANVNLPRQRQLLRQAGTAWSDELLADGAVAVEYARGFPAEAKAVKYDFRSPAWATIELLVLGARDTVFRGSPNLRGLRRLYALPTSALSKVAQLGDDRVERPLDFLSLHGYEGFEAKTILAPTKLGVLYDGKLGLDAWLAAMEALAALLSYVPVGRRVKSLVLAQHHRPGVERMLREANPQLEDIVFTNMPFDSTLQWT